MKRALASVAGAAALLAAAPSSGATAPAVSELKPCYVSVKVSPRAQRYVTEKIRFTASGFTPHALVTILVDGVTAADDVAVDGGGNLPEQAVDAPRVERGEREVPVSVVEKGNSDNTVIAFTRVSALAVSARPRTARFNQRVTFRGRGFTMPGRRVYGHYVRRGKHRRTVVLGWPQGPCGTFRVRRRQFPFRPSAGNWLLRIDQSPRYRRRPVTAFRDFRIQVQRRLRLDRR